MAPAIPMAKPNTFNEVIKGCFLRLLQAILKWFFIMLVVLIWLVIIFSIYSTSLGPILTSDY